MTKVVRHALVAALISLAFAACSLDGDRGLNVDISNGLDEVIVVTYEEPGHEMDVATLDPGRGTVFSKVFSERGPSCHGPFVARTMDGGEVARAAEMCPGVVWRISAPDASPSS